MSRKIYKLCLIRGFTEAYYQLSEEQRGKLWENVGNAVGGAGGDMVTPYYNARWSNDTYTMFFTMVYPDIESAIADTAGCEKAELFRYMISETILGFDNGTEIVV